MLAFGQFYPIKACELNGFFSGDLPSEISAKNVLATDLFQSKMVFSAHPEIAISGFPLSGLSFQLSAKALKRLGGKLTAS
jgi:hypothetical protein